SLRTRRPQDRCGGNPSDHPRTRVFRAALSWFTCVAPVSEMFTVRKPPVVGVTHSGLRSCDYRLSVLGCRCTATKIHKAAPSELPKTDQTNHAKTFAVMNDLDACDAHWPSLETVDDSTMRYAVQVGVEYLDLIRQLDLCTGPIAGSACLDDHFAS